MTLQEDMDSKQSWTQEEIDALKSKYRRIHFTHFQGVMDNPVHPRDDPEWVQVGPARWRWTPKKAAKRTRAGDMPEVQ